MKKMTIKELLAKTNPEIEHIRVTVIEASSGDSPPKARTWWYDENQSLDYDKNFQHRYFNKSLHSVSFSLMHPIRKTLSRKLKKFSGPLPPYYCGKDTVYRKFDCEIFLKPKHDKPERT